MNETAVTPHVTTCSTTLRVDLESLFAVVLREGPLFFQGEGLGNFLGREAFFLPFKICMTLFAGEIACARIFFKCNIGPG